MVFLDLKKAFDSVDRNKLLMQMEEIGVRGNALNWFSSSLADRHQFVSVNGVNSESLPVEWFKSVCLGRFYFWFT